MTPQAQLKAIAELDGYYIVHSGEELGDCYGLRYETIHSFRGTWELTPEECFNKEGFAYLTSRDAIIPVIEKQPHEIKLDIIALLNSKLADHPHPVINILIATPQQLCEALLRATGKWSDE